MRQINIDFLFYDDQSCSRCKNTKDSLISALKKFKKKHKEVNAKIRRQKLSLGKIEKSPTILINGVDLESYLVSQPQPHSSHCNDCSCITRESVNCRTYNEQNYLSEDQILLALEKHLKKKSHKKYA